MIADPNKIILAVKIVSGIVNSKAIRYRDCPIHLAMIIKSTAILGIPLKGIGTH